VLLRVFLLLAVCLIAGRPLRAQEATPSPSALHLDQLSLRYQELWAMDPEQASALMGEQLAVLAEQDPRDREAQLWLRLAAFPPTGLVSEELFEQTRRALDEAEQGSADDPARLPALLMACALGETFDEELDERARRAEAALELALRQFGEGSAEHVVAARFAASLAFEQDDYQGSLDRCDQAIDHHGKHPQLGTAQLINSLELKALNLRFLGRYDDARAAVDRGFALLPASEWPQASRSTMLGALSELQYELGSYAESVRLAREALELARLAWGPRSYEVSVALNNLAVGVWELGEPSEALKLYEDAVEIRSELFGPQHSLMTSPRLNLALAYARCGRFSQAEVLYQEVEKSLREAGEERSQDMVYLLNNRSDMLQRLGEYGAARSALDQALEISRELLGPEHYLVGIAQNNLASLMGLVGDLDQARHMMGLACENWRGAFGQDHPYVAICLSNLAAYENRRGEHERALELLEQASAIREGVMESPHTDLAYSATHRGRALLGLGRVFEARMELERAVVAFDELHDSPDNEDSAWARIYLGDALLAEGDPGRAEEVYKESVIGFEVAVGLVHFHTAEAQDRLARVRLRQGELDLARELLDQVLEAQRATMGAVIEVISDRERLEFVHARRRFLDAYLNAYAGPDHAERAWQAVLDWKGLAGEALRADRLALRAQQDPQLAERLGELEQLRSRQAELSFAPLGDQDLAARQVELADLTARKESLERELVAAVGTETRERWRTITPAAVCKALPRKTALADLLRYDRLAEDGQVQSSYVAFVVRSGDCGQVRRVELGDAQAIDALIERQRLLLGQTQTLGRRLDKASAALRERLWDPIGAQLGREKRVLFVPDGATSAVSLAVLPDAEGRYLVESYLFGYHESARDVLRWQGARREVMQGEALVLAAASFGDERVAAARSGCLDEPFLALPATAAEAELVRAALHARLDGRVRPLFGEEATEQALEAAIEGSPVVHLATHGFFATGKCRSALSPDSERAYGFNPMVLSGLALAGANEGSGEGDDGLWTAEEVSGLDLSQTQLVVLSACNTGLGEVRSGEGVLGLRRAFTSGGAGTVVMSLWAVPDEETMSLMQDLYRYLGSGRRLRPGEALRRAQLEALRRQRSDTGEGRPQEWGAFVAAGDWR